MKIKVIINIPDDNCKNCPYWGHSSIERSYQSYSEKDYCRLFGDVELTQSGGKLQRCIACLSCEIQK